MTTYTPKQFAGACRDFAKLEESLPAKSLATVVDAGKAALEAASHASGGVGAKRSAMDP